MADVRPFQGIRYNLNQINDLSTVITAPYDVISPDQQMAYYRQDRYSMIRMEFGWDLPTDDDQANKYTRAADALNQWLNEAILVRDDRPAYYLVEHRFIHQGKEMSYLGLIASVRLEDFGTGRILPTEVIMKKPASDRLNLLRACQANLSPIMGIFDHENNALDDIFRSMMLFDPISSCIDKDGTTYRLWVITIPEMVNKISDFFADRAIYIADGHHRYTTSLAYRDERLASEPGSDPDAPFNFQMMTLISTSDPGLCLLPTHRMVAGLSQDDLTKLREQLSHHFEIRQMAGPATDLAQPQAAWMAALSEAGAKGRIAFGMYGAEEGFSLLTARDEAALREMLPGDKPLAWKNLDVSLLHSVILGGILGIDTPEREAECLSYSPHEADVIGAVDEGNVQLAFLLNPVPGASVLAVADAGVRMPPKSTYFHPKTPAGLVINPLF